MNCRGVWLPHLVLVRYSSSHCKSCCSVCDQFLFGSGHLSVNQRRERCSTLLCMWVGWCDAPDGGLCVDCIHLCSVFGRVINLLSADCVWCDWETWIQVSWVSQTLSTVYRLSWIVWKVCSVVVVISLSSPLLCLWLYLHTCIYVATHW